MKKYKLRVMAPSSIKQSDVLRVESGSTTVVGRFEATELETVVFFVVKDRWMDHNDCAICQQQLLELFKQQGIDKTPVLVGVPIDIATATIEEDE